MRFVHDNDRRHETEVGVDHMRSQMRINGDLCLVSGRVLLGLWTRENVERQQKCNEVGGRGRAVEMFSAIHRNTSHCGRRRRQKRTGSRRAWPQLNNWPRRRAPRANQLFACVPSSRHGKAVVMVRRLLCLERAARSEALGDFDRHSAFFTAHAAAPNELAVALHRLHHDARWEAAAAAQLVAVVGRRQSLVAFTATRPHWASLVVSIAEVRRRTKERELVVRHGAHRFSTHQALVPEIHLHCRVELGAQRATDFCEARKRPPTCLQFTGARHAVTLAHHLHHL